MRKIFLSVLCLLAFSALKAQDTAAVASAIPQPSGNKLSDLNVRSGDHLMVQFATNLLTNQPDSISSHTKGFSRSGNAYIMLNKAFKSDKRMSVAFGVGISTSSLYFKKMELDLTSNSILLPITFTDSTNNYKKYKFTTTYAELPIELRFNSNPNEPLKGIKVALGAKVGTLLGAGTKGKNLEASNGSSLNNSIVKQKDKDFVNKTRIGGTARIGYGIVSLFGTYYFTPVFRDGVAPPMKSVQIGLTFSGL